MKISNTLRERFWNKVDLGFDLTDEDCWLWKGGKDKDGYGLLKVGRILNKQIQKHATHIIWYLTKGVWSALNILHKCDSPSCINPSHLFEGTCNDNNIDMVTKGRALIVGSENGNSILKESQVIEIKNLLKQGKNWKIYFIKI